jgi:regulator of RNase E activity RraA
MATQIEVTAEQLEALRREDCTAVYNTMKFAGLADPDAYSGPELRCAVGAVIGGSVMDIIPMAKLGTPIWATGVVPAYDQLRMAAFGRPVDVGPLKVSDGDVIMADQGGVIRIPRAAVQTVIDGMPVFRALERSAAEIIHKPGLTAKELRAWYAANEPEFLGDDTA